MKEKSLFLFSSAILQDYKSNLNMEDLQPNNKGTNIFGNTTLELQPVELHFGCLTGVSYLIR